MHDWFSCKETLPSSEMSVYQTELKKQITDLWEVCDGVEKRQNSQVFLWRWLLKQRNACEVSDFFFFLKNE